jgi:tetratricopeptide (TPR) repeat protein
MTAGLRALALVGVVAIGSGCSSEAQKQASFERGKQLLASGETKEAIIEFKNALGHDDKFGDARLLLADAYIASGQPELAYREYLRAADLLPDNARAQLKAGMYLVMAKQFDDALMRARRVLELEPENVEGQITLANALAGTHDVDGALTYINRAIAADPTRIESYATLAHLEIVHGRTDRARDAYVTAVTLAPTSVQARMALAAFQWSTGDRAGAEKSLAVAHGLDPANVAVNRALATVYSVSNRLADAERHLQLAANASGIEDDRLRLADFYIGQRRLQEARDALSASHGAPTPAMETRFARIEFLEGHVDDANGRLVRMRRADPNYGAMLLLNAQQSLAQQRWEDAIWEADAALAAQPRLIAAWYLRAEAELKLQRYEAALRSYTEIVRLDLQAVDAKVALSRLHLSRNAVDTAMLFAQEALNASPEHLGARLALIRSYLARGDDSLAAGELARLPAEAVKVPERHVLEAILHSKKHEMPAARAAFARALALEPTSFESLRALTAMDVGRRAFKAAAARIDAALALKPEDPDLLALSARVSLAHGDRQSAEAALRHAADKDPLNITTVALLVRVLKMSGRLEAAVGEFDARAARDARDVGARIVAAVAVHTLGNLADAERRYREVLRLERRAAIAANNLAAIYLERGENLSDAETFANMALEYAPNHPEVLDTMASVALRLRQPARAIKLYEQAIAIEPDNATLHYRLGMAYANGDDTERARRALGTAVRLNANLMAARQALDTLGR